MCGVTILQNSIADFTGMYIRFLLCIVQFNPNFLLSIAIKRNTSSFENALVAKCIPLPVHPPSPMCQWARLTGVKIFSKILSSGITFIPSLYHNA
jgi:hypothetical protein